MEGTQEKAARGNFANWAITLDDKNEVNEKQLLFTYCRKVRNELEQQGQY